MKCFQKCSHNTKQRMVFGKSKLAARLSRRLDNGGDLKEPEHRLRTLLPTTHGTFSSTFGFSLLPKVTEATKENCKGEEHEEPSSTQTSADHTDDCLLQKVRAYLQGMCRGESPMSHYHEHGEVIFKEAPMNLTGFGEELQRMYQSFPDFHVQFEALKIVGPNRVSVIIHASGTHTGAPYSFGPFPEIQPQGTRIENDPERCTFDFRDGKILKLKVEPLGENTGPPGFYTQIGGLIF